jgi:hypothetical protein
VTVSANFNSNSVSVFLNTTAPGATVPTFAARLDFATGTAPHSVAFGDLNGDGRPDLAVANSGFTSGTTVSVLLNATGPGDGVPGFSARQDFTVGTEPLAIAVGDVNGDGKPDLVAANYLSNTVSLLLNTTTPGGPRRASQRSRTSPPTRTRSRSRSRT